MSTAVKPKDKMRSGYVRPYTKLEFERLYGENSWCCSGQSSYIVHDENGTPLCWGETPTAALMNDECKGIQVQQVH